VGRGEGERTVASEESCALRCWNSTPGSDTVTRRTPRSRALSGAGTAAPASCAARPTVHVEGEWEGYVRV
jgi:hypothetical protein